MAALQGCVAQLWRAIPLSQLKPQTFSRCGAGGPSLPSRQKGQLAGRSTSLPTSPCQHETTTPFYKT